MTGELRVLLPVPGLGVTRAWDVGQVRFHPPGALGVVLEGMSQRPGRHPEFQAMVEGQMAAMDKSSVAEVSVPDGSDAAMPLVAQALAILRVVQHVRSPMSNLQVQTFGLPGEVPSAGIPRFELGEDGLIIGASRVGALDGWTFSDGDHAAWTTEPAYRFMDDALDTPDHDRTELQQRVLIAAGR